MWKLPGPLLRKLNFKFVINSKTDFSEGQKHERLHFDTEFVIFRSTWEKGQKHLLQTSHKFFSMLSCEFLILMSISVQNICKNSFSGGKSRKNGIPVIKITFLKKIPQNYRFPWVNTKTITYTCRFDTL